MNDLSKCQQKQSLTEGGCLQGIHSLSTIKMVLKIILVQGFCPLKIKITQFPEGFHLNILLFFDIPFTLELKEVE